MCVCVCVDVHVWVRMCIWIWIWGVYNVNVYYNNIVKFKLKYLALLTLLA